MNKPAIALLIGVAVLATGCSDIDPEADGQVTGRDVRHNGGTHSNDYFLTINGTEYRVHYDTYDHCVRGSHYPTCKN